MISAAAFPASPGSAFSFRHSSGNSLKPHAPPDIELRVVSFPLTRNSPNSAQISSNEAERTPRSEEHTSELQSLMRISYAVFCLKQHNKINKQDITYHYNEQN